MPVSPTSGNSPLARDLVINQGENFAVLLDVVNSDGSIYVFGTNLGRAEIRSAKNTDSELLATFTVALNTPVAGSITLSLAADVTSALGEGLRANRFGEPLCVGWYDLEVYNPSDATDVPVRLIQGKIFLDLNVTN